MCKNLISGIATDTGKFAHSATSKTFTVVSKLLKFGENKEYIREVLLTVNYTSQNEKYVSVDSLDKDNRFFTHLKQINGTVKNVPSHAVITTFLTEYETDFRYEDSPNPIKELQDRKTDNTTVGLK